MVLAKGHNARWPLTSLHCWRSWTPSRSQTSTTASVRPPRPSTRPHRGRAHRGDRCRSTRANARAAGPAQRPPAQGAGDHGWGSGAADPQATSRVVLPLATGAAPARGPGPVRRRHGGLPARGQHRKVDDLVRALGADSGISKSEVSRICADLDAEVAAFRDRSLAGQSFPDVFVDATYLQGQSQPPRRLPSRGRPPRRRLSAPSSQVSPLDALKPIRKQSSRRCTARCPPVGTCS
jgi:Transposase, Mutator family